MVKQYQSWWIPLSALSVAWVRFPVMAEYFKGFFPDWSHSVNSSWASVAKYDSVSPQWHHTCMWTSRCKTEVQPRTDDGWLIIEYHSHIKGVHTTAGNMRSQPSGVLTLTVIVRLCCRFRYRCKQCQSTVCQWLSVTSFDSSSTDGDWPGCARC